MKMKHKMKNILKTLVCAAAAVFLIPSCTKSQYIIYENDIQSKVYFTAAESNPLVDVSAADLDEEGCFSLCIYNAGNNSYEISVSVKVDENALKIYSVEEGVEYKLLPEKYWSLPQTSFTMDTEDNYQVYMPVQLDIAQFEADGLEPDVYVLPLTLVADSTTNLTFDYKTVYIRFKL